LLGKNSMKSKFKGRLAHKRIFLGSSHLAVIRVYDAADNVIETHEHKSDFKEP